VLTAVQRPALPALEGAGVLQAAALPSKQPGPASGTACRPTGGSLLAAPACCLLLLGLSFITLSLLRLLACRAMLCGTCTTGTSPLAAAAAALHVVSATPADIPGAACNARPLLRATG